MSLMPSGHQIQLRLVDYIGKVNLTCLNYSVFVQNQAKNDELYLGHRSSQINTDFLFKHLSFEKIFLICEYLRSSASQIVCLQAMSYELAPVWCLTMSYQLSAMS